MSKDRFVAADEPKLDEIIRQAESRLAAQLTLAVAADQRAMTLATILATGTVALIAWAITLTAGDGRLFPVTVLIGGTIAAAACALWSARPVAWNSPGNTPDSWVEDIADGVDDLHSAKAAMASYYAEMIVENATRSASNANWLRAAMLVAFVTLAAGAAASAV